MHNALNFEVDGLQQPNNKINKNRKMKLQRAQAHQNWMAEAGKNIVWSDECRIVL